MDQRDIQTKDRRLRDEKVGAGHVNYSPWDLWSTRTVKAIPVDLHPFRGYRSQFTCTGIVLHLFCNNEDLSYCSWNPRYIFSSMKYFELDISRVSSHRHFSGDSTILRRDKEGHMLVTLAISTTDKGR